MSERLTGRCADNNEPYAKFHDYVSCADRLAEIEDMVYDASGNEIISLDRLHELAEAEREDRIHVSQYPNCGMCKWVTIDMFATREPCKSCKARALAEKGKADGK